MSNIFYKILIALLYFYSSLVFAGNREDIANGKTTNFTPKHYLSCIPHLRHPAPYSTTNVFNNSF